MKREQMPSAYYNGRFERMRNKPKSTAPYPTLSRLWAWWVAGWNDADIEQGQKK